MNVSAEQFWELLQQTRQLRELAARQVELLEAILAMQGQIEQEIQSLIDVAGS